MGSIVRAIDVGRGNTKFVGSDDGDDIKYLHFPSEAYPSEAERKGDGLGSRRKTVSIPVDGLFYEVGPDVHLAADVFNAKVLQHDAYFETAEYLALVRGALHYMKVEEIDLLVVGLPVATFKVPGRVSLLEKRMLGKHDLGGGRSVVVKKVRVLAQPTGALMHYGMVHNRLAELRREKSLIIDPGARTFDWIVTQGMQQIESKSHSLNRGMFDVLQKIAEGISMKTGTQFREFEPIDAALRGGKKPILFQKEYDISAHLPVARKVPEHAVAEMLHYVGDASDIQNIIIVGGGAFFFKKAIKDAFPRHKIHELKDALYANVKGFQLAGRLLNMQEQQTPKAPPMVESDGGEHE
ncbi:PRTRC system protein D [Herbaspirillum sp. ST 5-3]|uniref:PRTRC system protein D n=1 Tax=Oxalobacteraceae TaxID=75682 RepID=UPI0010A429BD|nr:PRTRC system protein D [Herbaspirillum sp. ST 5-3]